MKTLFLLEDSADLAAKISRLADRRGWNVIKARCLEEAEAKLANDTPIVSAAMIDLMVPMTTEDLARVDTLLGQRATECTALTRRVTTPGNNSEERQQICLRIDQIDQEIMNMVVDDGGIRFLASDAGKRMVSTNGISIAIFTARRRESAAKDTGEELITAVKNALGREPDKWFEKPMPPSDLEAWLDELAGRNSA